MGPTHAPGCWTALTGWPSATVLAGLGLTAPVEQHLSDLTASTT
jgi:hypothetical protein